MHSFKFYSFTLCTGNLTSVAWFVLKLPPSWIKQEPMVVIRICTMSHGCFGIGISQGLRLGGICMLKLVSAMMWVYLVAMGSRFYPTDIIFREDQYPLNHAHWINAFIFNGSYLVDNGMISFSKCFVFLSFEINWAQCWVHCSMNFQIFSIEISSFLHST